MPYIAKPDPCFLDSFPVVKVVKGRKVYKGHGKYYTWDELHGEIEVFDKQGYHLGVLDAVSGKKKKTAVKGRRLNVR